jgi:hypothetical protein
LKKKDFKALFIIHQCVDADNFEKVGDCETSKEACEFQNKSNWSVKTRLAIRAIKMGKPE